MYYGVVCLVVGWLVTNPCPYVKSTQHLSKLLGWAPMQKSSLMPLATPSRSLNSVVHMVCQYEKEAKSYISP